MKTNDSKESNNKSLAFSLEVGTNNKGENELTAVCAAVDRLDVVPYQRFMYVNNQEQKKILKEVDTAHQLANSRKWSDAFKNSQGFEGSWKLRDPESELYKKFPTINKVIDRAKQELAECLAVEPNFLHEEVRYVRQDNGFDWHADKVHTVGFIMTFGEAPSTNFAKNTISSEPGYIPKEIIEDNYETVPPGAAVVFRRYDAVHSRADNPKDNPRLIVFIDVPTAKFLYDGVRQDPWPDGPITEQQEKARKISDHTIWNGSATNLTYFSNRYTPQVMEAIKSEIAAQPNSTILELKELNTLYRTTEVTGPDLSNSNIAKNVALGAVLAVAAKSIYDILKTNWSNDKSNSQLKNLDKKLILLSDSFNQLHQKRLNDYAESQNQVILVEAQEFEDLYKKANSTIERLKNINQSGSSNTKELKKEAESIWKDYLDLEKARKLNAVKKSEEVLKAKESIKNISIELTKNKNTPIPTSNNNRPEQHNTPKL